jgi:hypothetical protein
MTMGNVIDITDRIRARAAGTTLEVPQCSADLIYPDSNSVSDDLKGLAEHISAIAGLLQRDLLGPEQIANNLTRLIDCAARAAVRTKKLETRLA